MAMDWAEYLLLVLSNTTNKAPKLYLGEAKSDPRALRNKAINRGSACT